MTSTLLKPKAIIPTLSSGLLVGILDVGLAASFAALIFAGPLAPFVPYGIGYALAGFAISGAIIALFTSWPGFVGGSQSAPAAIVALMAAAIAGLMPVSAASSETFITVTAAIVVTTLLTGLFFLAMGYFELGNLARFLPYPVIGGFLAGTGWLLISGAVSLMADMPVNLAQLPALMQVDTIAHWLPGILLAIVTMLVLNYFDHYLALPGMLLLALILFFAYALVSGVSLADLSAGGWLLGPFGGGLWRPITPAALAEVSWPAVANQAAGIASVVLISTVSLLLNAGGMELEIDADIDINKELRVAGMANTVSALCAGLVAYQQISFSVLNHKMDADSRLTGVIAAAVCLLALLAGASLLALFPTMIAGALLALLGLSFIVDWVIKGWSTLPRIDYAIVIMILLVTALAGFLQAVALGLLLAVVLFVVGYSQVEVVRHELSGATYHSRVVRSHLEKSLLIEHGEEIYILQLQGFIFFGTADSLLKQIRERVVDVQMPPLTAVVLDFEHVNGLDSTAMISFGKLGTLAAGRAFALVVCGANRRVRQQLEQGGLSAGDTAVFYFENIDDGLAWCEGRLLARAAAMVSPATNQTLEREESAAPAVLLAQQVATILKTGQDLQGTERQEKAIKKMISYFEEFNLDAGALFINQGRPADSLYFLVSGQITARLAMPDGRSIRLETLGEGGRIVGEIAFFLGGTRTADVVTEEPSTLFRLTRDDLQRMELDDPQAASLLRRLTAKILSERVTHLTNSLAALDR